MNITKDWRLPLGIALAILCFISEFVFFLRINDGFHDSQTFLDASRLLNNRENPYLDPFFLNSYTLALPFKMYASFFPAPWGPVLWNLFNAAGLFLFISLISPSKCRLTRFWILLLTLATSPARAMFASVQHTGIILGCLAISFFLAEKGARSGSIQYKVLSGIILVIPFELKPQFAIPVILLCLVHRPYRLAFLSWINISLLFHLLVSLYFGMPLDKLWLERLLMRSEVTTTVSSGDNSLWIIPSSIMGHANYWLIIGFSVYAIALVVLLRFTISGLNPGRLFVVGTLIPISLPYVHTYDYLVVCVYLSVLFFEARVRYSVSLALLLFLLPTVANPKDLLLKVVIAIASYFSFEIVRVSVFRWVSSWYSAVSVLVFSALYMIAFDNFSVDNLRISLLLALGAAIFILGSKFTRIEPRL